MSAVSEMSNSPNSPNSLIQPRPQPTSLSDLFWSMTWLALQGFGGVLAVVQRILVDEKRWLTNEEFIEDWAVAQVLPGPNVVNLALMIGDRYFGLRGGLAALAGILAFPLLVVLIIAALFASVADLPMAQGALKGMGAVSAGLIAAVGLKLISALKTNVMSVGVCIALAAITFVAIAILRIPLASVLLGLGTFATAWAYRQIGVIELAAAKADGGRP
jgi:chromate transporter